MEALTLNDYLARVLEKASFIQLPTKEVVAYSSIFPTCFGKGESEEEALAALKERIRLEVWRLLSQEKDPPALENARLKSEEYQAKAKQSLQMAEENWNSWAQSEILNAKRFALGESSSWHPDGHYSISFYARCPKCRGTFDLFLEGEELRKLARENFLSMGELTQKCPDCGSKILFKPQMDLFDVCAHSSIRLLNLLEASWEAKGYLPHLVRIELKRLFWNLISFAKDLSDYFGDQALKSLVKEGLPQNMLEAECLETKFLEPWEDLLEAVRLAFEIDPYLWDILSFRAERVFQEIVAEFPTFSDLWKIFDLKIKLSERKPRKNTLLQKFYELYRQVDPFQRKVVDSWAEREGSLNLLGHLILGHLSFHESVALEIAQKFLPPETLDSLKEELYDFRFRIGVFLARICCQIVWFQCLKREALLFLKCELKNYAQRFRGKSKKVGKLKLKLPGASLERDVQLARGGDKDALARLLAWEPLWGECPWVKDWLKKWTYDREWYEKRQKLARMKPGYLIPRSHNEVMDWIIKESIKVLNLIGPGVLSVKALLSYLAEKAPEKREALKPLDPGEINKKVIKGRKLFP